MAQIIRNRFNTSITTPVPVVEDADPLFHYLRNSDFIAVMNIVMDMQYKMGDRRIDINAREPRTHYTPLICAVSLCESIFNLYGPDRSQHPDNIDLILQVRLRNLQQVASAPNIKLGMRTHDGWSAETMAIHPDTRQALYTGLNTGYRKKSLLHSLWPPFRFTP